MRIQKPFEKQKISRKLIVIVLTIILFAPFGLINVFSVSANSSEKLPVDLNISKSGNKNSAVFNFSWGSESPVSSLPPLIVKTGKPGESIPLPDFQLPNGVSVSFVETPDHQHFSSLAEAMKVFPTFSSDNLPFTIYLTGKKAVLPKQSRIKMVYQYENNLDSKYQVELPKIDDLVGKVGSKIIIPDIQKLPIEYKVVEVEASDGKKYATLGKALASIQYFQSQEVVLTLKVTYIGANLPSNLANNTTNTKQGHDIIVRTAAVVGLIAGIGATALIHLLFKKLGIFLSR